MLERIDVKKHVLTIMEKLLNLLDGGKSALLHT